MTHPGSFSATSESLTALGCSPLRMGAENAVQCYVLSIGHRYDAVFAVGEGRGLYWTSLAEVNRFSRE